MNKRASGVLMHVSSLPGAYGIGCFGKEAKEFIDFLSDTGCTYWQVLPFTPTDAYNSPYASISAFAGNRNFIDLEQLRDEGLLTDDELREQMYANPYSAAFDFLELRRIPVLYRAFTRADEAYRDKVRAFAEENKSWLPDYALYIILKEANIGAEWYDWADEDLKLHRPEAVAKAMEEQAETVLFMEFIQYTFFEQWKKIKKYANSKGVEIIGDLPMYVARNSADVWANRHLFDLTEDGEPKNVAGVPPDYFSEFGQKWGNPLYNWAEMKKDGYRWWMDRLGACFKLFDAVRIDHFRAFSAYWAVPAEAETAKEGQWLDGPKTDFFDAVNRTFKNPKIIAEDLGIIDDAILWFKDADYVMPLCIVVALWTSLGTAFLSFIAGLQNVPRHLYEAGAVDGIKNRWQELWYITLPSMQHMLLFSAVMQIVTSFSVSTVSYFCFPTNSPCWKAGSLNNPNWFLSSFFSWEVAFSSLNQLLNP